nr:immunoglobulin heavy chain junction region [Mus musculus]NSM08313.1 immunoglobulin heavy chain junction region [Mus musculus]
CARSRAYYSKENWFAYW